MRRAAVAAVVLLATAAAAVAATYPAPSLSLQSAFAPPTGIARTDFADSQSPPSATAVDGDRILTVGESGSGTSGDVGIEAHHLDGSVDTSFSDDGRLIIPVTPSVEDKGVDLIVLPDHRIRILATTGTKGAIIGLTPDGAPDTAFGAGDPDPTDGIVRLDGLTPTAFALAADGRLAVTGSMTTGGGDSFVAEYNADGSPVTSFGGTGVVPFDRSGSAAPDAGTDVVWRPGSGPLVYGSFGPSGSASAYLRAFADDGSLDPSFSDDGDLVPSVGESPTVAGAALVARGALWITGSTRTGIDTNAFLARYDLNGGGEQSRQFDMRGQLIDPAQSVTSVGDELALVSGTPDTLVLSGSVEASSGKEWAAAAFNNLDGDVASFAYGDIAIGTPGNNGIVGLAPAPDRTVIVSGGYQEQVNTGSVSFFGTRVGEARLAVDAEKQCNLGLTVTRPLELTLAPGGAAAVDFKVVNAGTRACAGTITAPAPWSMTPVDTGTLAPGQSFTAPGVALTYGGPLRRQLDLPFTLAATGDSDTSDNLATLHVRFTYCDLALAAVGSRAFMPSEGSRRFSFVVANGGTTTCARARVRVTGQGRRTSRAAPFAVGAGRSLSDAPAVTLRKRAKVGTRALIGFAASGTTADANGANDSVVLAPMVLGVGDTDAQRPRGSAEVIRGIARGGRGPAARKLRRVTRVSVAVRRVGGGCRWLSAPRKARFRTLSPGAKGRCTRPVWLRARGTSRWSLRTAGLPPGDYELLARATIGAGFTEAVFSLRDRNRVLFTVRA